MIGVILAAGCGTRLRSLTYDIPKGLVSIGGKTLLEYSLDNLAKNEITKVIIVTGYLGKMIQDKFGAEYKGILINYIENNEYAETGSMYSFSKAKNLIDDDVILLESDLLYDEVLLREIKETNLKDFVLVAPPRGLGDEVHICVDKSGRLTALGKEIQNKEQAIGELVGISKFSKEFLSCLFEEAEKDYLQGLCNYHYEEVVFAVNSQIPVYSKLVDSPWTEIDNEADLEYAKREVLPRLI